MIEIVDSKGNVVSISHNLRGLRRIIGKHLVKHVYVTRFQDGSLEGSALLTVVFVNGNKCQSCWASYTVLKQSLRNWRNLYGVPLTIDFTVETVVYRWTPELQ